MFLEGLLSTSSLSTTWPEGQTHRWLSLIQELFVSVCEVGKRKKTGVLAAVLETEIWELRVSCLKLFLCRDPTLYSFTKQLFLNAYYVMDVTLDAGDTSVNTTDKVPTFMELTFWEEKQKISKENPSGW